MSNKKTAFIIILLIIVLSIILYFLPLNELIGKLPIIKSFYNNTSLEIVTQKGKAKIWINGKEYGETPTTIENLSEGNYTVELEKIVDGESFYNKQSFPIQLTRNTSSRLDIEIGPDNLIHGTILYYTPLRTSSSQGYMTVVSNIESSKIFLDKEFLKSTPITNLPLNENQYQLKITSEGYEDIEVPILVRKGYSLNIKTYQFPIPIEIDSLENTNE